MTAHGVNDIEARHVVKTNVSDHQTKVITQSFVNSVASGVGNRDTITAVLKNDPEGIGHAGFILDDENCPFLPFPLVVHILISAIVMPGR